MSKSNRLIVFVMAIIMVMATVYMGYCVYRISRLASYYQQEGWLMYVAENNQ